MLFVTPEYNRSIPGALKNAIDWASRPWGENSFDHIPAAVIGASIGQIGTAMGQQSLRGVLSFCNARQMTSPEAYIHYSPDVFQDDGEVTNDSTREFLTRLHGRVPHLHRHGPDRPASHSLGGGVTTWGEGLRAYRSVADDPPGSTAEPQGPPAFSDSGS